MEQNEEKIRAGDLLLKLSGDDHLEALKLKGAALWDPGKMNHPMKNGFILLLLLISNGMNLLALLCNMRPRFRRKNKNSEP